MNWKRYNKYFLATAGGLVGFGMALVVAKVPGAGTCEIDAVTGAASNCVILGMSEETLIGFVATAMSGVFVRFGPKNAE